MLTTDQKGTIAELAVAKVAIEAGAGVAYSEHMRRCYLLPFEEVPRGATVQLRATPTRNNQERRIRWAKDFEFAATLMRLGAIAQLGERVAGSDEVAGSSPAGSTSEVASPEAALF